MISFFSVPKAFNSSNSHAQRNAIRSWRATHPEAEIVLLGDEHGISEIAKEVKALHVFPVPVSPLGTPMLNFVFQEVNRIARFSVLCYLNADIILTGNLQEIVLRVSLEQFLITGKRTNLNIDSEIDVTSSKWKEQIESRARETGVLGNDYEMDYFIFKKGAEFIDEMPAFAVGRPCWDNWLVYRSRFLKIPVIDATKSITIVHQAHSYAAGVKDRSGRWIGTESDQNLRLAGDLDYCFGLQDADFEMHESAVLKKDFKSNWFSRSVTIFLVMNENHVLMFWWIKPILWARKVIRRLIRQARAKIGVHNK